jgi:thiamine biosynthesis lipoprotein
MGTVFSFDIRSSTVAPGALDDVVRWLHWVEARFSTYRLDSDVSRLRCGELELDQCVPAVGDVLRRCAALERETDGYFSAYAGGVLDPSGFVKGWAIERASDMLRAAGSSSHCVNGGGDVQCVGEAAPGVPWRVGIAHPLRPGMVAATVTGTLHGVDTDGDFAVATSGTAERGTHVIDPHSGRPVAHFASVSIVGPSLCLADAYATAAVAMGPAAQDWVRRLPGYYGFAVQADGRTWCTKGRKLVAT